MKTIFAPSDFPTQFQAIGVMRGTLLLEEDMRKTFLVLSDGVKVKSRLNVHKLFLCLGILLGIVLVGFSKLLKYSSLFADFSEGWREFYFDIVFEIGVALIGAPATAYLLRILLNKQQRIAKKWRAELRRRINQENK